MKTNIKPTVQAIYDKRLLSIFFIHLMAGLCLILSGIIFYENLTNLAIMLSVGISSLLIGFFLVYLEAEFDTLFSESYHGKKTAFLLRLCLAGTLSWLGIPTFASIVLISYAILIAGGPIHGEAIINCSAAAGISLTLLSIGIMWWHFRAYKRRLKIVDTARIAGVRSYHVES